MSAWSFPKRGSAVEMLQRSFTAESLDGQHVVGRATVHFDRAIPETAGSEITATAVAAIVAVVGETLCEGQLPFSGDELATKVLTRARSLSARVAELRVDSLELLERRSGPPATATSRGSGAPAVRASQPVKKGSATSGFMPKASSPQISAPPVSGVEEQTLWARTVAGVARGTPAERIGGLLAPALRDSTAVAIFAMLQALHPTVLDRLELIEGRTSPLSLRLRRDTSACLAAAFYRVLVKASVAPDVARALVDAAREEALAPDKEPPADIERYIASEAPLRELARVTSAALGAPQEASGLLTALSQYGMMLRAELTAAAAHVVRLQGAA